MTYTATAWNNNNLPAIDAANLLNIENFNVAVAAGGRTGVQAGSLASEHAGLPIGVQLPLNATLIWTDSNMGAGSGMDADKLDGQQGAYYMPVAGTGTNCTFSGTVTVSGTLSCTGGGSITGLTSLGTTASITAGTYIAATTNASVGTSLTVGTSISMNGALSGVTSLSMGGALSGATTVAMGGTLTGATSITMSGALSGATTIGMGGALTGATSISMGGALTGATTINASSHVTSGGTITGAAFNVNSTRAIKENISLLTFGGSEVVSGTPVYMYSLKSDPRHDMHIGFIVEDTPACLVNPDASGIDLYASLAYAYKAIQELTARVETLERK